MTNLPITTSTPQTAAASKQATNAADTGDTQSSQPFGQVLARQISGPATKDAKADDKAAVDMLAQLGADSASIKKEAIDLKKDGADSKKTDQTATDGTPALPADMLAALLPQTMNTAAAASSASSAKTDGSAIGNGASQDKRGITLMKSDVSAAVQADASKVATGANSGSQTKEQAFAATLTEAAGRNPAGMGPGDSREALTATAAAQQSNAAALASMQNNAVPVMPPVQVAVKTPVSQDKWGDEFSQKITWLASSKQDQTAELHLNPPQLGPVDVVIKVSGDQATALFTSPHAAVREAIEQAMPKLRDMMADNGIMLGNATVSDQTPRDQGQSGTQRSPSFSADNDIRDTVDIG